MQDIDDLIEFQRQFDSRHSNKFRWDEAINDNNVDKLLFLVASLAGESGEAINIVKKVVRGDLQLKDVREALEEELTDVFIYLLKLSYQFNFNLVETYFKKMEKNEERFKNYEHK